MFNAAKPETPIDRRRLIPGFAAVLLAAAALFPRAALAQASGTIGDELRQVIDAPTMPVLNAVDRSKGSRPVKNLAMSASGQPNPLNANGARLFGEP